ncbi:type II CAAX endopeptidase family protein [Paenibacillus dokdonensis]|uniref:Type II CAAX endopeptidase family protein n=1 Tax=Paenibacillus dokdonensis TaxID=2567944 RepID=A0ABU6GMT9_9BACL|nr:type II CAAX endopeptidase family protein [Paenibacillus dokdonensis]MEC0241035.1 type II CAAX endopeptidase family protein [Paenibacillus dokdonensis]
MNKMHLNASQPEEIAQASTAFGVTAGADQSRISKKRTLNNSLRIFLKIFTMLLIYFGVMYTFLGILVWLGVIDRVSEDYGFLASMNIVVGILLSATVMIVYRWKEGGRPLHFGWRLTSRDGAFLMAGLVASTLMAVLFTWGAGADKAVHAEFLWNKLQSSSFILLLLYGALGWFVGALQEEVLDRGYYFRVLEGIGPAGVILLSSFIFSLTHIPTKGFDPVSLAIHFIGGVGYGYVYLKSGSLLVSTAVHAFHNLLLDVLFNNDYNISLVSFHQGLLETDKLIQQVILISAVMAIAGFIYRGKGVMAPADNLKALWSKKAA